MKQVILDTNFLLIPAQFKVDIFSEIDRIIDNQYQIFVLSSTKKELEKLLRSKKLNEKQKAKLGLQLIEHFDIKTIESDTDYADEAILQIVHRDKHIVATQDKELKKKLKAKNIPVIVLRKKSFLQLIRH